MSNFGRFMKMLTFHMKIESAGQGMYAVALRHEGRSSTVVYNRNTRQMTFSGDARINSVLQNNKAQFAKILGVKKEDIFVPGFELNFALCDGKDIGAYNNLNNILAVDRRNGMDESFASEAGMENITELYVDGSYREKCNGSGYAVIIKYAGGDYKLYTFRSRLQNSCLVELQAAITGLEILADHTEIRIVSDSQYVRKGLTEWIFNWKINHWHTSEGRKVRNIAHWKKFDSLADGKYIEFRYVRGHSGHFENTMADLYARDMSNG
ncbi:MAG: ribonuclease HI [Bacteroidales bacterium]|nr:ribonuclease HI [Bacteroidales bacterium]